MIWPLSETIRLKSFSRCFARLKPIKSPKLLPIIITVSKEFGMNLRTSSIGISKAFFTL